MWAFWGAFIPGQQAALISELREAAAALRPGSEEGDWGPSVAELRGRHSRVGTQAQRAGDRDLEVLSPKAGLQR